MTTRLNKNSLFKCTFQGLATVAITVAAMTSSAEEMPTPHRASYSVKISVAHGALFNELIKTDSGYTGTSKVNPSGWVRLIKGGEINGQANFSVSDAGTRPLVFLQSDTISKKDGLTELHFDWSTNRLTGNISYREKGKHIRSAVDEKIEPGSLDPISLQYALMRDLMNNGLKDQYILVDGEDTKIINISRLEKTELSTPYGQYEVIPVQHQAASSSRITTFWFAPKLNYLPIRIEQYKGGKQQMVAVLENYQVPPYEQQ